MPISVAQKAAIADIVKILIGTTASGRGRRHMATVFVQLVDEALYPEYYKARPYTFHAQPLVSISNFRLFLNRAA